MVKNQKGFAPIIFILGIFVALGLIVGGSVYIKNNVIKTNTEIAPVLSPQPSLLSSFPPSATSSATVSATPNVIPKASTSASPSAILRTNSIQDKAGQTKLINDDKRLEDLAKLQIAINVTIQTSEFTGPELHCGGIGQSYPCFGSSIIDGQSATGNGWIKMDLISQQAYPIQYLPLDPINNSTHHYVYCADGDAWEINTVLESSERKQKMIDDSGDDDSKYEVGSSLLLIDKNQKCKY